MYFMAGNCGRLIFKNGNDAARIEKLCNALQFAASMKQLSMAIESGAAQDCGYELKNAKGLKWVLACRASEGMVALDLWFQQLGINDKLDNLFNWRGNVEEFKNAINNFIDRLPKYRFCWF